MHHNKKQRRALAVKRAKHRRYGSRTCGVGSGTVFACTYCLRQAGKTKRATKKQHDLVASSK
jgi:hypothetical protein